MRHFIIVLKKNLGDIDRALDILKKFIEETNTLDDNINNMWFTVRIGKLVFKRNTADDHDKKFYSYSLQVNIIFYCFNNMLYNILVSCYFGYD